MAQTDRQTDRQRHGCFCCLSSAYCCFPFNREKDGVGPEAGLPPVLSFPFLCSRIKRAGCCPGPGIMRGAQLAEQKASIPNVQIIGDVLCAHLEDKTKELLK